MLPTRRLLFATLLTQLCAHVAAVRADPPLNIQQLLVERARWQLLSGFDYGSASGALGVERRSAQFTSVLRYGAAPGLEFNARLHGGEFMQRFGAAQERTRYRGAGVGANWMLRDEDRYPALLLEGSVDLYEHGAGAARTLPGGDLVLTAYRSLDPLVLSLSAGFGLRRGYRSGPVELDDVRAWSVTPQVNFAVNHRVTLIGGLAFRRRGAPRIDGERVARDGESLALRAGLGFLAGPASTVFVSGDLGSEAGESSLSLRWFYSF